MLQRSFRHKPLLVCTTTWYTTAAADEVTTKRQKQIIQSVSQWSNVNLQLVPSFPTRPPCFQHCYIDIKNPIYEPVLHVCQSGSGGSMHRVGFILALNHILKVPEKFVNHIVEIGQCLHNVSLMVDDICDDTDVRRGAPTAHIKYGVPPALLGAYSALFHILLSVEVHLNNTWVALEECARMHHCNSMEVYARDTLKCLTEAEYMHMVDGKTGSGFRVITRMLMTLASAQPAWVEEIVLDITNDVGRFFQIRDDLLDLVSEEFAKKKGGYGSDFKEGKFSFPVIHCVSTRPETEPLFLEVFRKPAAETTEEDVSRLTDILRETGSLDFTLKRLEELATSVIGGCEVLEAHGYQANSLKTWFSDLATSTDGFQLPSATAADCPYPAAKRLNITAADPNPLLSPSAAKSLLSSGTSMLGMNMMQKLCFSVLELDLTTNLQEIDTIIRQVLACYEIYFEDVGLTAKDFWTCFPWFLLWKGGIKATAEKGQSKLMQTLVARSPFADDVFYDMFEKATAYYRNKHQFLEGKRTDLSPEEMCERKPSNFRIMRWLLQKWYQPGMLKDGVDARNALENYLCVINAEQRLPVDIQVKSYNIVLHFQAHYGQEGAKQAIEAYKQQMWAKLSEGGLQPVAQRWVEVQEECVAEKHKVEDFQIGARDVVKAAFTVARACMEDMELGSSTLKGQSRWLMSHFRPQSVDSMFTDWMVQMKKHAK